MLDALTHYVAVLLPGTNKKYFFSTSMADLKPGDDVIVETSEGRGMAKVASLPVKLASYSSEIPLKPIIRRPTEDDYEAEKLNRDGEKAALYVAEKHIKEFGLPMRPMSAHFDLDGGKCTINFASETRVDFRELVKVLAKELDCRIELHQVASRDRAKMIGGVGVCGLPLCCSTFLQQFGGIGLALAKNQMLTINIPKLSGHCGKLICCLAYEDGLYTEAKKDFPRTGTMVSIDGTSYKVDGFNVLSRTVKLVCPTEIKNVGLEEYEKISRSAIPGYERKAEAKPASGGSAGLRAINGSRAHNSPERPAQKENQARRPSKGNARFSREAKEGKGRA